MRDLAGMFYLLEVFTHLYEVRQVFNQFNVKNIFAANMYISFTVDVFVEIGDFIFHNMSSVRS